MLTSRSDGAQGEQLHSAASARAVERWRQLATSEAATRLPACFVLLSLPFLRPNLMGENGQSVIGFAVLCVAAVLAVVTRRSSATDPHADASASTQAALPVVVCLGLAYLWLLIQAAALDPGKAGPRIQGVFLTVGAVCALVVVCRDERSRLFVGRGFVLIIGALCASYLVTALIWAVFGVGSGVLASIPIGGFGPQPVYLPFTPTEAVQTVLGTQFPRFTGIGREPGWMAMYCAIAYFMADMVGWRSRRLKVLLVIGLLGTISTAGFGVFVVTWAYKTFLSDRGTGISVGNFLRQIGGVGVLAGALWLAVDAPVLGLSAKATQNATSLDQRTAATQAGLRALTERPLGGNPTTAQAGINLISDISVSGLPFVLLALAALLLPMLRGSHSSRLSNAVIIVVLLTLLTSQPARDSTWAFGVVALAVMLGRQTRSTTDWREAREHP